MDSLTVGFNVIIPLVILMGLGYFLRLIKLIDETTISKLNTLVFKLFLPVLIFKNIYSTDLAQGFDFNIIGYAIIVSIICYLLIFLVIFLIEKDKKKTSVLIQGIFRTNFVIFGIPVIASLFGENNLGIPSIVIAAVVPVYNTLAVITLEIFNKGEINIKRVLLGIIKNPLIIASIIGVIFLFTEIKINDVIYSAINDVAKITTPLSLIVLGSSFVFKNIRKNLKQNIIGIIGRLVVVPFIFVGISILIGFRGIELATLMIMFGAPTAVSSYTMAKAMGGDEDLACSLVVLQTILSVFTIFIMTSLLTELGYLFPI